MTSRRIRLDDLTDNQLDALYDERDQLLAALRRVKARRTEPRPLDLLGVRRWSEPGETTPVAIEGRDACGLDSGHVRRGCLGLSYTDRAGGYGLIHLTPEDAARLADLLHAMTPADPAKEPRRA